MISISKISTFDLTKELIGIPWIFFWKSARSNADERMVQKILAANAGSNRIWIYDARPKRNAMANVLVGGGFEDVDDYEDMDLGFLEIHNIHVMRESLRKVKELCFPNVDDKKLLANIENTQVCVMRLIYHLTKV